MSVVTVQYVHTHIHAYPHQSDTFRSPPPQTSTVNERVRAPLSRTHTHTMYDFARWLMPLFAMSMGRFLVQASAALTDQTFLVMLLTVMCLMVVHVVRMTMRHFYLANDGVIDASEHVNLMGVEFIGIVVACMIPSFMFLLLQETFDGWTLPVWYEIVVYAWLLIIVVILLSRYIGQLFDVAKAATDTVITVAAADSIDDVLLVTQTTPPPPPVDEVPL